MTLCGACNDGICDWMPCSLFFCDCNCNLIEGNEMTTKRVLETEATDADVIFDYDDDKYTIPSPKLWPLEAVEAQEANQILGFVKALLGDTQYKTLRKKAKTINDLDKFVGTLFDSLDLDSGK